MKNKKTRVTDKELNMVTGGQPDEIRVKIKTLDGDNDDYSIKLTDTIQTIMDKYNVDDKNLRDVTGGHSACGGICGTASDNMTTIQPCSNSVGNSEITGSASAGGICGTVTGNTSIKNCNNIGNPDDNCPAAG